MDQKDELLGLADKVKETSEALITATREQLTFKIELDKKKAVRRLALKEADTKMPEWIVNAKIDVEFEADDKIELDKKLAAKQAEIDFEYAHDRLTIGKLILQVTAATQK